VATPLGRWSGYITVYFAALRTLSGYPVVGWGVYFDDQPTLL